MDIILQKFDGQGNKTEEKTYHTTFICGKAFRDAFKITNELMQFGGIVSNDGKSLDLSKLDTSALNVSGTLPDQIANFIVEIFNYQFTTDEFWQGIDARNILNIAIEGIQSITGTTAIKTTQLNQANPN